MIAFTQPIYVDRNSAASRDQCKQEILRRVHSPEDWPQVVIFSEGTVTNRAGLLKFKAGAFAPSVPVQPVVLRCPNRVDCATWTFNGPSGWWTTFVALTQFYTSIEITYMPVYTPTEMEKRDSLLYARNVQTVMAQ